MSDNAELHGKVLGFLMAEWARKDNRQLVAVDLLFSPGSGFKDEEVRKWIRADEPDPGGALARRAPVTHHRRRGGEDRGDTHDGGMTGRRAEEGSAQLLAR